MGTAGWGFVAELNSISFNQLVVKCWTLAKSKLDAVQKEFTGVVPIKYGLALYYDANINLPALPKSYTGGLDGQPIHATPYAEAAGQIVVRLAIAVNIDLRAELRFPGELGAAREAGEFIHTLVSTVWLADAQVIKVNQGTSLEELIIDVPSIRIDHIDFLGIQPSEAVKSFINKLAANLLPKFMGAQDFTVSPLYGALSGVGMTNAAADFVTKTLGAGNIDVTGQLTGDSRFDPQLVTYLAFGLRFSYGGSVAPVPGAIPFFLPYKPDQTVALSTTQWALSYLNEFIVPKLIDDAVKQKIGNNDHRGMMAIDVLHGGQITDSDDDGIFVLTDVYDLKWNGSRFSVQINAYVIQRGLFGWDDLAPDIQLHGNIGFGIKPNDKPDQNGNIDYSKPIIEDVSIEFSKKDSLLDTLEAPFVMAEKFVMSIADAITGQWGDALRNGVEVFADMPFLITTIGFFVALFGGIRVGDQGIIPSLKFSLGQDVVLEIKQRPTDVPGGAPFNAFTLYMTVR